MFPGTRSERCVPAVNTPAPVAAAAAELARVDARPCSGWDLLLRRLGLERDCLALPPQPQQLAGLAGAPGPGRGLVGALALGGLALVVGWTLLGADDDDEEEAP